MEAGTVGDLRTSIIERLDRLNEAIAQQRPDDEVKRLKAEVATLNVKLAATERVSTENFTLLVERALHSW